MIYLFLKLIFLLRKPKLIIVLGNFHETTTESIFQCLKYFSFPVIKIKHINFRKSLRKAVLSSFFGNKTFLIESSCQNLDGLDWMIKKSMFPILIINGLEIEERLNNEKETENINMMVKSLPFFGYLVLNSDDKKIEILARDIKSKRITFGFHENSDFKATDTILTDFPSFGTNFKLNFKGMIIPIWLKGLFGKEEIYAALSSVTIGVLLKFNLVKISESLRDYVGIKGKMKLIKGIKKSWILDNSNPSSVDSIIESLGIVKNIPFKGRKVLVLGNLIEGGDSIKIYEEIGEKIFSLADILITFGSGAKIIAEKAKEKGMDVEKIFKFDTIEQGKLSVQEKIRKDDLVLVGGSKEMKMSKIIDEIKKY